MYHCRIRDALSTTYSIEMRDKRGGVVEIERRRRLVQKGEGITIVRKMKGSKGAAGRMKEGDSTKQGRRRNCSRSFAQKKLVGKEGREE